MTLRGASMDEDLRQDDNGSETESEMECVCTLIQRNQMIPVHKEQFAFGAAIDIRA